MYTVKTEEDIEIIICCPPRDNDRVFLWITEKGNNSQIRLTKEETSALIENLTKTLENK